MDIPYIRHTTARVDKGVGLLYIDHAAEFSEVWAVTSRNSLYQIPVPFVALEAGQRAKSYSPASLSVRGEAMRG
jgi:hypothetical protein